MAGYLETIASELGIKVLIFVIIIIWSAVWKLIALWKSARNKHLVWFIIIGLVNSLGIKTFSCVRVKKIGNNDQVVLEP